MAAIHGNRPSRPTVRMDLHSLSALWKNCPLQGLQRAHDVAGGKCRRRKDLAGSAWMLESDSGQFDAQIAVDPADRRTVYAAWLQNNKRVVMLAKSVDSGATWSFTIAVRGDAELDKPALAVRGQNVYVAFNHEEEVWVAASQDGGRSFTPTRANAESRPGWSLLGAATVDPAGNAYLAWASYSKAGGARGAVIFI